MNKEEVGEDYIYQLADFQFDHERISSEFIEIAKDVGIGDIGIANQYNFKVQSEAVKSGMSFKDLFFDFSGSLASRRNGIRAVSEREFDMIHPVLHGTYIEEVIEQINRLSPVQIGRIRWLSLDYKTCYSMHRDPDWYRLHIPIKTVKSSFLSSMRSISQWMKLENCMSFILNGITPL
jgi:hypothetical protein